MPSNFSPRRAAKLLFAFGVGRALPIIFGAVAVGWLQTLKGVGRSQKAFEVVGGVLLVLAGLYRLNAYFIVLPALAV